MGSPARLDHAGNFAAEREKTQTNTTQLELSVVRTSPAADLAAIYVPYRELRRSIEFCKLTGSGHCLDPSKSGEAVTLIRPKGHTQVLEERATLLVGLRRSDE